MMILIEGCSRVKRKASKYMTTLQLGPFSLGLFSCLAKLQIMFLTYYENFCEIRSLGISSAKFEPCDGSFSFRQSIIHSFIIHSPELEPEMTSFGEKSAAAAASGVK